MTNEEAIRDLRRIISLKFSGSSVPASLTLAMEALKHYKKGHFEFDPETGEYRCSECGHFTAGYYDMEDEPVTFDGLTGWALKTPHYCKYCGAYMRGEDDG